MLMAASADPVLPSWDFLSQVVVWSLVLGVCLAVVGGFLTRSVAFASTCLVGTGLDAGTLAYVARRGRRALEDDAVPGGSAALAFAGRLALKAVVLAAAFSFPAWLDFRGAVAGVLVVDATLLLVATVVTSARLLRVRSR
jgi:hypothetical protein